MEAEIRETHLQATEYHSFLSTARSQEEASLYKDNVRSGVWPPDLLNSKFMLF